MQNTDIFLYPGQGSQHVGMGLDLYKAYAPARERFAQADRLLGFRLSELCFEGPEEDLNSDVNAQLAMYTVCCIITDLLKSQGRSPAAASGYSAGFYAAAYAAGCFDFEAGLRVVRLAGESILGELQDADGCMAVIFGLGPEPVERICERSGRVWIAIVNTPRQIVISGTRAHVEHALLLAKEGGALDTYYLPVAAAYHSPLLRHSAQHFLAGLADIPLRAPHTRLVSYTSLEPVADSDALARIMADQLTGRVFWVDLIEKLNGAGPCRWFEVGPGEVLARTIRWIDRGIDVCGIGHAQQLRALAQDQNGGRAACSQQECYQA